MSRWLVPVWISTTELWSGDAEVVADDLEQAVAKAKAHEYEELHWLKSVETTSSEVSEIDTEREPAKVGRTEPRVPAPPQPGAGWIAVSERKPDDQTEVLMLWHHYDEESAGWTTYYEIGWLEGDTWFANYRASPLETPHYWMDPPSPPAKGDQT